MKYKNWIFIFLEGIVLSFFAFNLITAIYFTPLIRWNWGFYNIELIYTIGLILTYILFKTYWNTIKIRNRLENEKM
jgi:hypothetical protein